MQVNIEEEVDLPIKTRTQGVLDEHIVRESKSYHFVSTCNWDYPDFKGITSKIDSEKPYLFVKELGKNGGQEHHHLYFFSHKSLNTVKKYLKECNFLNLKYTDPNNIKYNKFDDPKHFRDLHEYKNLGCIVYLLKGITNHMTCNDDLTVKPNISDSNIEDLTEARDLYEYIIKEVREKREIILKDKVDKTKQKSVKEMELWLSHIEEQLHIPLPDLIGSFFRKYPYVRHSSHKAITFYETALQKHFIDDYEKYIIECLNKTIHMKTKIYT